MLTIILIVSIVFVIACALFNLRVSWANVNGRYYHDRRLVYFIVAEMATAATAFLAWRTSEIWLVKIAMNCEAVGDNGGLAYLFLLVMGISVVIMTGVAVYSAGAESESFWAARAAKH